MMEMEVAENGPTLARADEVLKVAIDQYWVKHNGQNKWHFIRTSTDKIKDFTSPDGKDHGKTIGRMMRERSKFPFQDL